MGRFEESIKISEEALDDLKEFEDQDKELMRSVLTNNIGTCLLQLNQKEEGLSYFLRALAISRAQGSPVEISRNLHNIGATYEKMDLPSKGLPYLLESLEIRQQIKDTLSLIETHIELGSCYAKSKQNSYMSSHFNTALEYAHFTNNFGLLAETYFAQSEGHVIMNNYKQALEGLKNSIKYQDSQEAHSDNKAMLALEAKYDAAKKDATIAQQEAVITKSSAQKNLFIAVATFLIASLLITYQRFKKNKIIQNQKLDALEKQQQILAMDSILQGQDEERKRIASDLHDGLGALLTTARIQIRNIEKEISALNQEPLFSSAEKTITQASTEVRRISHNMMPSAVEDLGLTAA